jgi:hypothetical protein
LGERLLCKQEVAGSIPAFSTTKTPEGNDRLSVGALGRLEGHSPTDTTSTTLVFDNRVSGKRKR